MTYTAESKYDNNQGILIADDIDALMAKVEENGDDLESWDCYEDGELADFQCNSWVSGKFFHEQCENSVPWPDMGCGRHA